MNFKLIIYIYLVIFNFFLLNLSYSYEPPFKLKIIKRPDIEAMFNFKGERNCKNTWCGGDGVYSIPLTSTKVLWVFGDTFWGNIKNRKRVNCKFLNNTIGIMINQKMQFYKGLYNKNFFFINTGKSWLWPLHGKVINNTLFLFFIEIVRLKNIKSNPFAFKVCGNYIAEIKNFKFHPYLWEISYIKNPFSKFAKQDSIIWGSYILEHKNFYYIYGIKESNSKKHLIISRISKKSYFLNFENWQVFTKRGFVPAFTNFPAPVATNIANEFSIEYNHFLKKFVLVYSEPALSNKINAIFSLTPYGPFLKVHTLYHIPKNPNPDIFYYSGKSHFWMANKNNLIISYIDNSVNFSDFAKDSSLYFPKFIEVKFEFRN